MLELWGQTWNLAKEAHVRHMQPGNGGDPSVRLNQALVLPSGPVCPSPAPLRAWRPRGTRLGRGCLVAVPHSAQRPSGVPSSALSSPVHGLPWVPRGPAYAHLSPSVGLSVGPACGSPSGYSPSLCPHQPWQKTHPCWDCPWSSPPALLPGRHLLPSGQVAAPAHPESPPCKARDKEPGPCAASSALNPMSPSTPPCL